MTDLMKSLKGTGDVLSALAKNTIELDQKMAAASILDMQTVAQLFAVLKTELGENLDADLAMKVLDRISPNTMRMATAEFTVRGDVSTTQDIEVEAGVKIDFVPYVGAALSGAYSRKDSENWGAEVRMTMAALPKDGTLLADFVRRAQERPAPEPKQLGFLESVLPVLKEVLAPKTGTEVPEPTEPQP